MKVMFKSVNKAYGVNAEKAKNGVYWLIPETNLELLVRPATVHNKEFMKKQLEFNFEKSFGENWQNEILFNDQIRLELAKLYHPAIIVDYRYNDTKQKQEGEELELQDIADLFAQIPTVFKELVDFCTNFRNFQIVEETEAKN